jgi:hypothetical protein
VSILFAAEISKNLRFTVARTVDRAVNPATGSTEQRHLIYAVLISVSNAEETSDDSPIRPARTLAKGPAVPYFSPPREVVKGGNQDGNLKVNFSSAAPRHKNEESELRDAKEKAMDLLMDRLEMMMHAEIGNEEKVEVWDSNTWKHAQSSGDREESVKSLKRGSTSGFGGLLQKF